MEENYIGEVITGPTYFRLPDLLTVASHESLHVMHGPAEFKVTLTGVILEYDDIVLCECRYPNRGEDANCIVCEKSLEGLERLRFWKLVPNMEDVQLEISPLEIGAPGWSGQPPQEQSEP